MPPKGGGSDLKGIVLQFLNDKNRPYSTTNLVDELHGEYTKTNIQKALDALSDSGKITCKLFGKSTKLYFAVQDGKDVASSEQLAQIDGNLDNIRTNIENLKAKVTSLRERRDKLQATKKIEDLRAYRVEIEQTVQKETVRKDELVKSAEGITPEEAENASKMFNTRCEQWKKRKAKCMEIIDSLSESTDKNRATIIEEMGLETDESSGVKLEYKDRQYKIVE